VPEVAAEYQFTWDGSCHYLPQHDLVLLDCEKEVLRLQGLPPLGYSRRDGFHGEPDQCVKTVDVCKDVEIKAIAALTRAAAASAASKTSQPRPRRGNPWFFDIPNDKGVKKLFWFNLNT
jgi:hypothetical protein